jgi:NADH:ubiquinone oxidoreductase subunit K
MSQTQRQQQSRARRMPPRGSFLASHGSRPAAGQGPTMQAIPQDTLYVPPGSMFVLGSLGVLMGVLANLWQIFTSFSAFQHLFVTGAIYQHMDTHAQSAALPIITIVCALVAIAFQLAILYLVFRVDRTWKETRAQGTGRATDAARHTAVEVIHHVPLLLIWGVLGFIADTVGDYTFISLYANAPFLQFMYGAALYASSTIMLVGAIEFLWAGMISFEKFKAWKRGLERAAVRAGSSQQTSEEEA